VTSLASTAGNSVPVSSLDVLDNPGLLVAIVAKRLSMSGFVVPVAAKFTTGVTLWGLGIPLDRALPLPGEALVCP
jgi:hypothetical protein